MAPNLAPGLFKIVSLINEHPAIGVNHTRPAAQRVRVGGPVTTWRLRKEGDGTYVLSVGGYAFTGVEGNHVIASIHPQQQIEWRATYRKLQDAYTIAPAQDDVKGWTVPHDEGHGAVLIKPIIATKSIPPKYLTTQLFRFERVHNEGALDE